MDALKEARAAMTPPSHFGWSQNEHPLLFKAEAFTFSVHRDSDALERSNWRVITKDLTQRFQDDCRITRARHWAVGWIEHLVVRVLTPGTDVDAWWREARKPVDERAMDLQACFTPAYEAAMEWKHKLERYPVADEDDYSGERHAELRETLTSCFGVAEEHADEVLAHLEAYDADDLDDDEVEAVKHRLALGYEPVCVLVQVPLVAGAPTNDDNLLLEPLPETRYDDQGGWFGILPPKGTLEVAIELDLRRLAREDDA